jgi:hypothetical protein
VHAEGGYVTLIIVLCLITGRRSAKMVAKARSWCAPKRQVDNAEEYEQEKYGNCY